MKELHRIMEELRQYDEGGNGPAVFWINGKLRVEVERDEDGWLVATMPQIPGCHTRARTFDDLVGRVREAIDARIDKPLDTTPEKS